MTMSSFRGDRKRVGQRVLQTMGRDVASAGDIRELISKMMVFVVQLMIAIKVSLHGVEYSKLCRDDDPVAG